MQEIVIDGAPQLPLDQTTRLNATVRGADGEPLAGRTLFWSTSDPAVATVDASGLVTPHALGRVQLAASAEGRSSAPFGLEVVRKRARTVSLVDAAEVAVGDTIVLEVSARAGDGEAVTGAEPTFSSTAPEVATVTADGRVVGRAPGSAEIVATVDGVTDTTSVTVIPAAVASLLVEPAAFELVIGQSLPLRVTLRDRTGAPLVGRAVAYTSSEPRVASVSEDGTVRGVRAGESVITATSGAVNGIARVRVLAPTPPPPPTPVPASLTITPSAASLQVRATVRLSTTLRDNEGSVLTGRSVRWQSSATSVATVSTSGLVTAIAPGAAVVTAESEGITDAVGITVSAVPVARVVVAPDEVTLQAGATQQLEAEVRDADGGTLDERVVAWTTSAPAIASVTSSGEVRALSAGTATITATSEGVQGTSSVTVTAAPAPPPPGRPGLPARIEKVSGDNQSAEEEDMLREPLVVRIVDANGRPVPGVSVLWRTDHGGRFSPGVTVTDVDGLASTRWRLGEREGVQRAEMRIFGFAAVVFTATARDD